MNQMRAITPTIAVADQPTEADLEGLKTQGYAGVVNLRNPGEPEQPLSPAAEGEQVRKLGLDYLHVGVGGAPLTETGVKAFSDFLDRHAEEKVLVHCRKGGRAVALVLLHKALAERWSPEETFQKGKALGLEVEGGLKAIIEQYLREHMSKG